MSADTEKNRLLIERTLLEQFSRMLAHDINGRVMGVEGIFTCWEAGGIDAENLCEDVAIVRDSFREVRNQFQLLNWFFQSDPKFSQVLSLDHFGELSQRFLMRMFKPAASFTLHAAMENRSVSATPSQLIFWVGSLCQLIGQWRPTGEAVHLQLSAGHNGLSLQIHVHSPWLETILHEPPRGEIPTAMQEWLQLFHEAHGTSSFNFAARLPITLTIPLSS